MKKSIHELLDYCELLHVAYKPVNRSVTISRP